MKTLAVLIAAVALFVVACSSPTEPEDNTPKLQTPELFASGYVLCLYMEPPYDDTAKVDWFCETCGEIVGPENGVPIDATGHYQIKCVSPLRHKGHNLKGVAYINEGYIHGSVMVYNCPTPPIVKDIDCE